MADSNELKTVIDSLNSGFIAAIDKHATELQKSTERSNEQILALSKGTQTNVQSAVNVINNQTQVFSEIFSEVRALVSEVRTIAGKFDVLNNENKNLQAAMEKMSLTVTKLSEVSTTFIAEQERNRDMGKRVGDQEVHIAELKVEVAKILATASTFKYLFGSSAFLALAAIIAQIMGVGAK